MRKIIFFLFPFLLNASDIKTSPLVIPHEFRPYVDVLKYMCNNENLLISDAVKLLEPLVEPFKTLKFDYPAYLRQFLPHLREMYLPFEKNYHDAFKLSCSIEPLNDYLFKLANERKTFVLDSFNNNALKDIPNLISLLDAEKERVLFFIEFEGLIKEFVNIHFKVWNLWEKYYAVREHALQMYITSMQDPEERYIEECAIRKRKSDCLKELPSHIQQKVEKDRREFHQEIEVCFKDVPYKAPSAFKYIMDQFISMALRHFWDDNPSCVIEDEAIIAKRKPIYPLHIHKIFFAGYMPGYINSLLTDFLSTCHTRDHISYTDLFSKYFVNSYFYKNIFFHAKWIINNHIVYSDPSH